MQYLISFLEGVITFISPCILPMIPIYILYFAGGNAYAVVAAPGEIEDIDRDHRQDAR